MNHIRKIYLSLAVFGLLNFSCFGQWDLIHSDSTGLSYGDMQFITEDTGFVLAFSTPQSTDYILRTVDGGISWDTVAVVSPGVFFQALHFPVPDTGYAVGNFTNVYRTTDAGQNWSRVGQASLPATMYIFKTVNFYSGSTGVISTNGYSWITHDAGVNWDLVPGGVGGVRMDINSGVVLIGSGNGYFYSYDTLQTYGVLSVLGSASVTGMRLNINPVDTALYMCAIGQSGGSLGYPYHNYGVYSKQSQISENAAVIQHFPSIYHMRDVAVTDNFIYLATDPHGNGDGIIMKSTDGGATWYSQQSNEPGGFSVPNIEKIQCLNDTLCYSYSWGTSTKLPTGAVP